MSESPTQIEIRIQTEPIDVAAEYAALASPQSGGRVVFTGCVRDREKGDAIDHLDYEHYAGMAERELNRLAGEACARWDLIVLRVVHRIGRVDVPAESVVISVASKHSPAAFEAARFMIDELKKSVPIWKSAPGADAAEPEKQK